MKKFLAILMAAMMVLAMASSASAVKVTMDNQDDADGAVFAAYKLMDASISGTNYFYSISNDTYRKAMIASLSYEEGEDPTDEEIIAAVADLGTGIRLFANEVYELIKDETPDATSVNGVFADLPQGYYLIVETDSGIIDDSDPDHVQEGTFSLVILNTAGEPANGADGITIHTKDSYPTLNKEIKHNESETWGVVGDNQIGDTVEFRTITTVPSYTGDYETYIYTIHDTMSVGLTSNVKTVDDVTVKVENTAVLDAKYLSVDAKGNTFALTIDVKQAIADGKMNPGESLYTYYSGILNENAKYAKPENQDNRAYLEYSNNPYDDEQTTNTPEVVVYDWTFIVNVKKVDGMTEDKEELQGAKFVLTRNNASLNVPTLGTNGEPTVTTGLIAMKKIDANTYRIATNDEITAGGVTYVVEIGHAQIKGLDDSVTYYLYEVEAPAGYNKLSNPVTFTISDKYSTDGSTCTEVTIDEENETTSLEIENRSGSELPTTGGIGTTIFYVLGGLMVCAAVVLLVTRRRMANN